MAQRPRDMIFPGLSSTRDLRTLRKAKNDDDVQSVVNTIVRAGCSIERMRSMLKRLGYKDTDIKVITSEAYPPATEAPAKAS